MQPVARALSSEETVNALTDLTQRAHALIAPAQTINIVNTVEYSVGYGPFVVSLSQAVFLDHQARTNIF